MNRVIIKYQKRKHRSRWKIQKKQRRLTWGMEAQSRVQMTFSKIPKGEYYLIETEAPGGFEKNPTAFP